MQIILQLKSIGGGGGISSITKSQEKVSKLLFQWFSDNHIKSNEDKCHFLSSASKHKFNFKLNVKDHLESICKKLKCQIKCIDQILRNRKW